jgi:hypothetical protein
MSFGVVAVDERINFSKYSAGRLKVRMYEDVDGGLQECAAVEALLQHAIRCARRGAYDDASDALDVVKELMDRNNLK